MKLKSLRSIFLLTAILSITVICWYLTFPPAFDAVGTWQSDDIKSQGKIGMLYLCADNRAKSVLIIKDAGNFTDNGYYSIDKDVVKTSFPVDKKVIFSISGKDVKSDFFVTHVDYKIKGVDLMMLKSYFEVHSNGNIYNVNTRNDNINYQRKSGVCW